ncbi:MAG: tRNA (adenosine(37)-N6)-threonylcarbamoyltransferase complex dimerization subunit type 1 TsaB [Gammaproteobacteria bacterium]
MGRRSREEALLYRSTRRFRLERQAVSSCRGIAIPSTAFSCLAIETSTSVPSLALKCGDRLAVRAEPGLAAPSRVVFEWLRDLLEEARCTIGELDCIAFGAGPGSFTGTRIAVAMAQGLGYSSGRPLCRISSLAALAAGVMRETSTDAVACCLDARLGEVYLGLYHRDGNGAIRVVMPDALLAPSDVHLPAHSGWYAAGTGWNAHPEMRQRLEGQILGSAPESVPSAVDVLELARDQFERGDVISPADAAPNYLRTRVASLPRSAASGARP